MRLSGLPLNLWLVRRSLGGMAMRCLLPQKNSQRAVAGASTEWMAPVTLIFRRIDWRTNFDCFQCSLEIYRARIRRAFLGSGLDRRIHDDEADFFDGRSGAGLCRAGGSAGDDRAQG